MHYHSRKIIVVLLFIVLLPLVSITKDALGDPASTPPKELVFYTAVSDPLRSIVIRRLKQACSRLEWECRIEYIQSSARALEMANDKGDGDAFRVANIKAIAPSSTTNLEILTESVVDIDFHIFTKNKKIIATNWDDLKNLKVGFRRGAKILEKNVPGKPILLPDTNRLFQMLNTDRLDVVIEHSIVGEGFVRSGKFPGVFKLDNSLVSVSGYPLLHKRHESYMIPLATTLRSMKKDGSYIQIEQLVTQEYFQSQPDR